MAAPVFALASAATGSSAALAGSSSMLELGSGALAANCSSLYNLIAPFPRHGERSQTLWIAIYAASPSHSPGLAKPPVTRRAPSSGEIPSSRMMASVSRVTALVDSLSLATNDAATAQAAAAEAVALARAAAKAAREAADFARLHAKASENGVQFPDQLDLQLLQHKDVNFGDFPQWGEAASASLRTPSVHRREPQGNDGKDISMKVKGNVESPEIVAHAQTSKLHTSSAMQKALDEARVTAQKRAEKEAPMISFSGISSSSGRKDVVVKSQRRAERLMRREKAAEKMERLEAKRVAETPARRGAGASSQGTEQYLYSQIGKSKLLTAQEEVELSKSIQDLMTLEKLKESLEEQVGRESNPHEWAHAAGITTSELRRRVNKGRESKNTMVMSNLRLVYSIAKKYNGRGVALEDLVSDGCKGLIRGTEKFDHSRGFKFSTYAHWWIRQAITRSITDQARTIRLPGHLYETLSRITKAREMLFEEFGRPPTTEEIAELVGISQHKLVTTMRSIRQPVSMETTVGQEGEETLGEILIDPSHEEDSRTDTITNQLLRADIENVLHTLNPREQDVLRLRYGLDDGYQRTLEEVGNMFRVTRERIRQIETNALRKLRQPSRSKVLREYSVLNS